MTRWKAAGIHLVISIIVAIGAMILMVGVMYPWEFFTVSGGHKLLAIMLFVDIVIGPLLTLVVFKTGKKSLKMDLTVIALLQVAALVYGMWNVVQARPVFLVHVGDRFYLVRATEITPEELAKGKEPRFRRLSWTGPTLAVALQPKNVDRQGDLIASALGGRDFDQYPETYADYKENAATVLDRVLNTEEVLAKLPEETQAIKRYLESNNLESSQTRIIPLKVGVTYLSALVDAQSAEILKIFPVDPW
ncbi:MAG: TfpX/TfpZ family type IV pilin accessory protein [Lysobacterales bacterium]